MRSMRRAIAFVFVMMTAVATVACDDGRASNDTAPIADVDVDAGEDTAPYVHDGGADAADDAGPVVPDATPSGPQPPSIEVNDFAPGPIAMRRLTRAQYVGTVRGLFGADLDVLEPREVDVRVEGLATIGASTASVTPAGIEGYDASARQIASAALAPDRRARLVTCAPEDPSLPDDDCAAEFVAAVAPLVLRRPLLDGESDRYVALARSTTETVSDFWFGLESILVGWLMSPEFLFIQERAADVDDASTGAPLTAGTLASRLSYFFWNQGPDAELIAAAADGSLLDDAVYRAQVERLIGDADRLELGVRALFEDLLELDDLSRISKDADAYPAFTAGAVEDAYEQTMRTIVDHLLVQRADYRDLFTTRRTFMTRNLGPVYDVPVTEEWEAYEFPENGPRAGIQSHMSVLALNAHASRSSPVLRGLFVLDKLLCVTIPPPPADISFEGFAPSDTNAPTARERLASHRADPACAGCHDMIDPIGLALENFDAIGRFRTHERGAVIRSHGEIFGDTYGDVRGFHEALRNSPLLTRCAVHKLLMHGLGRPTVWDERALLDALDADFERDGYDFVALMRHIALSHAFRATSGPAELDAGGDE